MNAPTDETLHMLQKSVIEAEKLSRYYGCLARRLSRTSELLSIAIVIASFAGIITMLNSLPNWISGLIFSMAAAACIVKVFGRYEERAAFSGNLCSRMQQLSSEWLSLWAVGRHRSHEDLRESWRKLTYRQRSALLHVHADLPVSNRLMLRCRRDAEQFWSMHNEAEETTVAERPDLSKQAKARGERGHATAMLDG